MYVTETNMSPVRYELGFYIPVDGILHSHRREYLKFYLCRKLVYSGFLQLLVFICSEIVGDTEITKGNII
jgi:hypothetical protein